MLFLKYIKKEKAYSRLMSIVLFIKKNFYHFN